MKKNKFRKISTSMLMLAGLVATPVVSVITSVPVSATVAYADQVTTPTGWHAPDGKVSANWSSTTDSTGVLVTISVSSAMAGDSINYKQLVGLNKGVGVADSTSDQITIKKTGDSTATVVTAGNLNYKFEADGLYELSFTDANGAAISMDITVVPFDSSVPAIPDPSAAQPMYRLYNPNSGEHFYTASSYEKGQLVQVGWNDEGTGWNAPEKSTTPVYRLYNPNAGDHFYTTGAYERDQLVKAGWNDEGIGWYSDDAETVPVYRAYNPNAVAGAHNYTVSTYEQNSLTKIGWKDEGIAWYGVD